MAGFDDEDESFEAMMDRMEAMDARSDSEEEAPLESPGRRQHKRFSVVLDTVDGGTQAAFTMCDRSEWRRVSKPDTPAPLVRRSTRASRKHDEKRFFSYRQAQHGAQEHHRVLRGLRAALGLGPDVRAL